MRHSTRIYPKTRAFDDFSDPELPNWVGVHGKFETTGGSTPDLAKDFWSDYAAGYHRTQMLSDNHRVKVTVPDGTINGGKSSIWLCGDKLMGRYYGLEVDTVFGNQSIIKGYGPADCKRYETTPITLHNGDTLEAWYDLRKSTVRGYQNGVEQVSLAVQPYEIQHGPGHRWCGVAIGTGWLDGGPNWADFEAWDVTEPDAAIRDTMDGPNVSPHWTAVLNSVAIQRNWFYPQTMGPTRSLFSSAAVVWDTPLATDSAKVVFAAQQVGAGKYTAIVCGNAALTSWIGIQFETGIINNNIRIVTGTGPTTYTERAVSPWTATPSGMTYTITYDHPTKTVNVYRGAKRTPFLSWPDSSNIVNHGAGYRRVGQMWQTSLLVPGVEPSAFEAYNVDANAPL